MKFLLLRTEPRCSLVLPYKQLQICIISVNLTFACDLIDKSASKSVGRPSNQHKSASQQAITQSIPLLSQFCSFSPLTDWVVEAELRDNSAEVLFQSFLQEALVDSFGMGRDVHPLMFSQYFPLPTTALPTLQGTRKDGFGEAAVARDMPEPCKSPSLDSWHKMFLWTHKEVDLAMHPVVGLLILVGDAEKFPQAHGVESLNPFFFSVSHQGPFSQPKGRIEAKRDLYSLDLLAKLMVLHHQTMFCLAIAEAILMQTSAEQVPSSHRVAPRYSPTQAVH